MAMYIDTHVVHILWVLEQDCSHSHKRDTTYPHIILER